MSLPLLLLLLGHDRYAVREYAERHLRDRDYETLVSALHKSTDPEARVRLQRLVARGLVKAVDRVLPDARPFWPDRDLLRDLVPVEYREQLNGIPVGRSYTNGSPWMTGAYIEYRLQSKQFAVQYIRDTGDWCGLEDLIRAAADEEEYRATHNSQSYYDRDSVLFMLAYSEPRLIKGNRK